MLALALLFAFLVATTQAVSSVEAPDVFEDDDVKPAFRVTTEANQLVKKFMLQFYDERSWDEDEIEQHFHNDFEFRSFGDTHHPMTGFYSGKQGWVQYRRNFDKVFEREYYYFESEEHTDIGGEIVGYIVQIGGHYKDRPKLKWQAVCYQFWTVIDKKFKKGTEVCSWHDGLPFPSRKNNIRKTDQVDPRMVEESIKHAQEELSKQTL